MDKKNFRLTFVAVKRGEVLPIKASIILEKLKTIDISRMSLVTMFREQNENINESDLEECMVCVSRSGLEMSSCLGGSCVYRHYARCNAYTASLGINDMVRIPQGTDVICQGFAASTPKRIFIGIPEKGGVWITIEEA